MRSHFTVWAMNISWKKIENILKNSKVFTLKKEKKYSSLFYVWKLIYPFWSNWIVGDISKPELWIFTNHIHPFFVIIIHLLRKIMILLLSQMRHICSILSIHHVSKESVKLNHDFGWSIHLVNRDSFAIENNITNHTYLSILFIYLLKNILTNAF